MGRVGLTRGWRTSREEWRYMSAVRFGNALLSARTMAAKVWLRTGSGS